MAKQMKLPKPMVHHIPITKARINLGSGRATCLS